MEHLAYISAGEATRLFRAKEVSPTEVLDAQLENIEKIDPVTNAITEQLVETAREQAKIAERRYLEGTARPLEGITIAAKEKHSIAGMLISEGSDAWDGVVATNHAPIIERIIDAGAVIHARTTTPEFSLMVYTHSNRWGITRNPWNTAFSPGGSSGGSGAAVAAGFTTLATASDIGGSTRGPAAFNGIVGYKPPYGRVPGHGPMSIDTYRSDGTLARTIEDTILFTNVISGLHPSDHASLRRESELPQEYGDVTGLRIALCIDLGVFLVDREIEHNTRAVAAALEHAGAEVVEVTIDWSQELLVGAVVPHFAQMMGQMVVNRVAGREEQLSPYVRTFLEQIAPVSAATTMWDAAQAEYAVQGALARAMNGFDALLCPTTATIGFPAGDDLDSGLKINDVTVSGAEGLMTSPFNICNRAPVLAVPSGFAQNGMPTGVQVVGHPFDEEMVFRISKNIETIRPWGYEGLYNLAAVTRQDS